MKRRFKYFLALRALLAGSILISLVAMGYACGRIIRPQATISSALNESHKAIQKFIDAWPKGQPLPEGKENSLAHDEERHDKELEKEQIKGFQSLKKAFILLVVGIAGFLLLGRIMEKEKVEEPIVNSHIDNLQ